METIEFAGFELPRLNEELFAQGCVVLEDDISLDALNAYAEHYDLLNVVVSPVNMDYFPHRRVGMPERGSHIIVYWSLPLSSTWTTPREG